MLIAGVPPLVALGTNKLQGLFGTASATITFAMRGHLNFKALWPTALLCFFSFNNWRFNRLIHTRKKVSCFFTLCINFNSFLLWFIKKYE
jgi:hypothetical protein